MQQVEHSKGLMLEGDVNLMAERFMEVQRKLVDFKTASTKIVMPINENKTKLMKTSRNRESVEDRVTCGRLQVEVVSKFKNLRLIVTSKNDIEEEIAFTKRWLSRAAKVERST